MTRLKPTAINYLQTLNLLRLTDDLSRFFESELTKRERWEELKTTRNKFGHIYIY